jgi:hypothetical protein
MFLIGDLTRFLSSSYYVRLFYNVTFYLFSLVGIVLSVAAIKTKEPKLLLYVAGIVLYLITVPTAADQNYYLLPLVPMTSVMMASGFVALFGRPVRPDKRTPLYRWSRSLLYVSVGVYLFVGAIGALYLLRRDWVFYSAAEAVASASRPSDLVLSLVGHDRLYVSSSCAKAPTNPEMHFLADRRGWNIASRGDCSFQTVAQQVEDFRSRGAKFLVITWYSADREPWFVGLVPRRFARDPGYDCRAVFVEFSKIYETVQHGPNFGVLRL